MKVLPTFEAHLELSWGIRYPCAGECVTAPKFKLSRVGLCLGQMFGQALADVAKKISDNVLKPLMILLERTDFY